MQRNYSRHQLWLHGFALGFVALSYLAVCFKDLHAALISVHMYTGLMVLVLTGTRYLLARASSAPQPQLLPAAARMTPTLQRLASTITWLLILAIPVTGLLARAFFGRGMDIMGMSLFTGFETSAAHAAIGAAILAVHKALANLALGLIAIHAISTFAHAYFLNRQAATVSATA